MLRLKNIVLPLASFDLAIDVELPRRVTAITGPSGAGKTSLLEVIAGLRKLTSGSVEADGADGAPADRNSSYAVISANGTKVACTSSATNLAPGVDGLRPQVYVHFGQDPKE